MSGILGTGPSDARIMIVGNCYSDEDSRLCAPFQGAAGMELSRMLQDAGIRRSECYLTNVINAVPGFRALDGLIASTKKEITASHTELRGKFVLPQLVQGYNRLMKEIELVKPNIIVALDTIPTWLLTGAWSVAKWRGSHLRLAYGPQPVPPGNGIYPAPKVIPTYPPSWVLAQWNLRVQVVEDLKRVNRESSSRIYSKIPKWNFKLRPSLEEVTHTCNMLLYRLNQAHEPVWIELDLETRAGHIACLGMSWSTTEAICIPFMCVERIRGYWTPWEEAHIIWLLHKVLTHSKAAVRWQNGLYDAQYIWRHWHFVPNGKQDTMISHHTAFVSLPKSLAMQSSLYSPHYVYWKDDGKTWEPNQPEEKLWEYNCIDCVRTREVGEAELQILKDLKLQQVEEFQQKLFWPVLRAMQLGVRVDENQRKKLNIEIQHEISVREDWLRTVLRCNININSSPQMQDLFYRRLGQPKVMSKPKKGQVSHVSCDDEALNIIATREPLLRPIINTIADIRTLQVLIRTFINAQVDADGRMRSSFNIAGDADAKSAPYTYRLSSSTNAFGGGCNFQNIPSDKSKAAGKAAARGKTFSFPNMRSMYVPDPGYTMFDMDLDRADLQVVVWEADDLMLKTALRMGVDIHLLNAYALEGKNPPPLEELVESHPKYIEHRGPRKHKREFAKVFCHACVAEDHEALTPVGWIPVKDIPRNYPILVCSPSGKHSHFEVPLNWWSGPCQTDMIVFEGQAVNQLVTVDHRMPYSTDKSGQMSVAQAQYLPRSARLPKSVIYHGKVSHPAPELLAAFHSDGSIDKWGNVTWHFRKGRKAERLFKLLKEVVCNENLDSRGDYRVYLPRSSAQALKLTSKEMQIECLDWTHETAVRYLEEQVFWDGHEGKSGGQWMSSVDKNRAELCHTLAHLHGYGSQWYVIDVEGKQRLYRWSLNARTQWRLSSTTVKTVPGNGRTVYCPTTTTGYWLTRRNGKISVTGNTNYGGSARTIAAATGNTIAEVDRAQRIWFASHPGIKTWHDRTLEQIQRFRFVENRYGYRWHIFDRLDRVLPQALAWIPQSTVGCYINRIWAAIYDNIPDVQILIQVHDSLVGQFKTHMAETYKQRIAEVSRIVIPYEDPLIIPTGMKTSEISWGDCV